jgi:hypothetical protein
VHKLTHVHKLLSRCHQWKCRHTLCYGYNKQPADGALAAYYAPIFQAMAMALGLKYERVVAEPDTLAFFSCIKAQNGWTTGSADGAGSNLSDLRALQRKWDLAQVARRKGDYSVLGTHHESRCRGLSHIHGLRQCGRSQQLRVDPARVAARLATLARDACTASREQEAPG